MSARMSSVLDIREILRRVRLGESDRAIATGMKTSRKTAILLCPRLRAMLQ